MKIKNYYFLGVVIISSTIFAQTSTKLKPTNWLSTAVPEPSDICYSYTSDTFFVVSDKGILFETNRDGKVLRTQKQKDTDFEAVYSNESYVYAVDESNRTIYQYDIKTFKLIKTIVIPYNGARNKGYEAFDYDKVNNKYVLLSESNPIILFELDSEFKIITQIEISKIASDISSARFYNGFLWLLSDEDMMLIKVNPTTYEVIQKWSLPLINPEGLAFDKDGKILITCDDMQRIYYFENPENK